MIDKSKYTYAPRETCAKNLTTAAQFKLEPVAIRKNSWKTTIAVLEGKKLLLVKEDANFPRTRCFI